MVADPSWGLRPTVLGRYLVVLALIELMVGAIQLGAPRARRAAIFLSYSTLDEA